MSSSEPNNKSPPTTEPTKTTTIHRSSSNNLSQLIDDSRVAVEMMDDDTVENEVDQEEDVNNLCDSVDEEVDEEEDDDDDDDEDDDDDDDEDSEDVIDINADNAARLEILQAERPESRQPRKQPIHPTTTTAATTTDSSSQQHQSQQQHPQYSHQNHVELLMSALDKLDPDNNGLTIVPEEITSSTLTTRLKGVCKINRLIEHCNDLCHSFTEIGAQVKYQESVNKFREWILRNKIIEHIFGPNCHVEIIKQSHTILNFVAYSLSDEHVNVIWSASLLKHCGRQVLDLLTSLIRFMRTGPVLHLYWLVRNLNIEDHSEHTLLLVSHILRFIWSHSPCINQIQYCNTQKNRQPVASADHEIGDQNPRQSNLSQKSKLIKQQQKSQESSQINNSSHPIRDLDSSPQNRLTVEPSVDCSNDTATPRQAKPNTSNATASSPSSNVVDAVLASSSGKSYRLANADEQVQWLATCIFPQSEEAPERSTPSRSTMSDGADMDKDLQQSLLNAIKGVTQHQTGTLNPMRHNSPNETIAKGGDGRKPADNFNQNVVTNILKTISGTPEQSTNQTKQSSKSTLYETETNEYGETRDPSCNFETNNTNGQEWLEQWKSNDFLDNTSDVSACCSEEKDMGDFDDDNNFDETDEIKANQNSSTLFNSKLDTDDPKGAVLNSSHNRPDNFNRNEMSDNTTSASRYRIVMGLDSERYSQVPLDTHFKDLKKASDTLSDSTPESASDDDVKELGEYNLNTLSDPGKTLLWDLLQDGKIEYLATNLHIEVENVLVNLVMSFGDRYIRYKFIEACLENLSVGTSVIISLRLLPKLMSFNTITRNLSIPAMNETHNIVLWAERQYSMSQNFFKNLVDYYKRRHQLLSKLGCLALENALAYNNEQLRQLEEFGELESKNPIFTHIDKIITRMSFLTFIYSKPFSPEEMKLNQEQMNQLWDCLASDSNLRCSDVLFQWIYQQAVGDDFHGVNDELLDYVLKKKMPTLPPETFRLRGLKLLEQLLWIRQDYECCHGLEHPATKLLWDVALKASDDEVSMAAIRILNHFYIYTNHQKSTKCDKGINFMRYCMNHLRTCLDNLTNSDESNDTNHLLDILQKVILLIRTHLEVFKAHWSYYLRILQLNNEADLVSHRLNAYEVKLTLSTRLVIQAASTMDKTTIEVQSNDFIGELRAEIVKWWYTQVDRSPFEQSSFSPSSSMTSSSSIGATAAATSQCTPEDKKNQNKQQAGSAKDPSLHKDDKNSPNSLNNFTEFLLANHHTLRLLSHSQEIPFDWDERQINELDFKDMQVIYVLNDVKPPNVDSADDSASDKSTESSQTSYMPKTEIPSLLLLRYEYFECLMEADRLLGSFRSKSTDLTSRAKTLSRRVWEIIQILPTCPHYKEDLKRCGISDENWRLKTAQCSSLFNADCPQRLLYSLQIIDILKSSNENSMWGTIFIRKGGLADIFDVFMSQKLLPEADQDWNEWLQECLAYLLKLLFQFGTKTIPTVLANESSSSSSSSKMSTSACSNRAIMSSANSIKRARRNRGRLLAIGEDRVPIPLLSEELLKLLADTDLIFSKLIKILTSSAYCKSQGDQYYYVSMSSRAMIVHHVMSFLASWCKSDPKFPKFQIADYEQLLKALILDDTDSSTRREACNGFFKLHHACTTKLTNSSVDCINSTLNSSLHSSGDLISPTVNNLDTSNSNWNFSADLLKCLIKFLPIAESMKPPKPIRNYVSENDYIRELNSPGCKDYFWLTSRLIDSPAATSLRGTDKNTSRDSCTTVKSTASTSDGSSSEKANESMETCMSDEPKIQPPAVLSRINLYDLCDYLVVAIRRRETYESRDFSVEDDTLRGMLHMMMMALRHDFTFRYTDTAFEFVHELYDYLFAPPTQRQRYLPKCKSPATRSTAFDLMITLVERCPRNYFGLLELLLVDQHNSVVKSSYPTDYWPHDDCRSEVGFVGLINLGATCYLATCMQHLFMIPNLRYAILSIEDTKNIRHGEIIRELQKIFAFMLESERKAYNPRNFCKVYTMDNHPLNIAEQTDMTEFLTDLITKLEESSPELRQIIKGLFSGTLSNNVVSLDCPHISRTTEEFYTLRVQVADMRNLNDSLDELTVKDTLEGDNMYTCSTCERKVRAEKRACIVKLPRILCFNTMRYTFNMATMTKEKVNTHFSFPLKLDMADYLEANLMKRQQPSHSGSSCSSKGSRSGSTSPTSAPSKNEELNRCEKMDTSKESACPNSDPDRDSSNCGVPEESDTMFELIGVTVHTGNADGGHYYCFIRDCEDKSSEKPRWYLFNDAEVKPFDDSHIGTECYGGELTTKSYDAINDRFMDFSIEKTNSAYMLFYKRVDYKYRSRSVALRYLESDTQRTTPETTNPNESSELSPVKSDGSVEFDDVAMHTMVFKKASELLEVQASNLRSDPQSANSSLVELDFNELCRRTYEDFKLPKYLANWIWSDNMKFVRDKNVFEHNYFNFMWQICANIPRTLDQVPDHVTDEMHLSDDAIAIRTVHLAIAFVLGVLMNSRERPNLSNWTELIRKQFNCSKAACDWLMHLIDDEETWLKQLLLKCPIEMVRQLFQRLCNDLNGSKQHKKLRLIK